MKNDAKSFFERKEKCIARKGIDGVGLLVYHKGVRSHIPRGASRKLQMFRCSSKTEQLTEHETPRPTGLGANLCQRSARTREKLSTIDDNFRKKWNTEQMPRTPVRRGFWPFRANGT
ncbi:hypothetical protein EBZ39_10220 [bacterium]|nr:hypothetical protein [bacterium]